MSVDSVLYMVLILGVVWGGFLFCLVTLARQREESESEADDGVVKR